MKKLLSFAFLLSLLEVHHVVGVTEETRSEIIAANNEFALDLLKKVYSSGKNAFFSPLSISTAVAMTSLGARGNTLNEIDSAFHFDNVKALSSDSMALHQAFKDLISHYQGPHDYTLNIANCLFSADGFELLSQFLHDTEEYYKAAVQSVNFTDGTAEGIINNWVAQQTEDKIKELFQPGSLGTNALLVLVNAIYFKGRWKVEFDPERTFDSDFHVTSDTKKSIKMMSKHREGYYYYKDVQRNWQVIELPYRGNSASMVIILPAQGGISDVVSNITTETLKNLLSNLTLKAVNIKIPKFTMEAEYSLVKTFKQLGINELFSDTANLTGISPTPSKVSKIKHKAFIEVDEVGTKATAATGIKVPPIISLRIYPDFVADRPFLFFIMDKINTRRILFAGVLNDP